MLSSSARITLLQLANNASQINQTQQRISSGRKFSSVLDGGADFFKARGYQKSADEFLGYKQNMDDGLSMIKSTMEGVKSSKSMLEQLRSVAEDSQDGTLDEATALSRAGNILSQYDGLLADTNVNGTNLVDGALGGGGGSFSGPSPYDASLWEDSAIDTGYSDFEVMEFI
ncbi:MAG: flagellin [Alphaproteobacteria bacterium]